MDDGADQAASALTLAIAGFLQTCRSPHTAAAYRTDLRHFASWCATREALSLATVDTADLARYRTWCEARGASAATVARRLSAIASFADYATEHGLDVALVNARDVERPAVEPQSTADVLSDEDADALLRAADEMGRRDAALIRLLMLDGLKVGEVIAANASDVGGRLPRVTLVVARHTRPTVVLDRATAVAVRRYLGSRRDGPLFVSERRGRSPERLTRFGVDYLVKRVAETAGLERSVSGNTLRRRYVMAAHARGTDLEEIRQNAGHATSRTTRRYLAPSSDTSAIE